MSQSQTRPRWEYPVASHYYNAMATYVSSLHNLPYWLFRAKSLSLESLRLLEHNLVLVRTEHATLIGWASRD